MTNKTYDYWLKKNEYYHTYLAHLYKFFIPKKQHVLQIGCKTGHILATTDPEIGFGVEWEEECIKQAQKKYPSLTFYNSLKDILPDQQFDYIILSSTTHETEDIQELFSSLQKHCHHKSRIIIDSYSFLWEPILWLTTKLNLRRKTPIKNWLSQYDIQHFLHLAGFDTITTGRTMLIPCYIPFISWFLNTYIAQLPIINRLCLIEWIIARRIQQKNNEPKYKVSVVIPCKNEKGNIEPAVLRCPQMGSDTEIIFVEGNSKDGTVDEIKRIAQKYPEKDIKYFTQEGKGKGDAVRKGFAKASGDILMILDADLTVPPEELPKFYDALINGQGEFINGSRLIYGTESEAMRFLNMIANHSFALGFSWLLGQRIKDTLCGTKVLFKKDYKKIAANRSYFGDFDPFGDFDLLFGAAKLNLKIIDLPVHYKARTYGTSQIRRFHSGFILLKMSLFALRKFKFR